VHSYTRPTAIPPRYRAVRTRLGFGRDAHDRLTSSQSILIGDVQRHPIGLSAKAANDWNGPRSCRW